LDSTQDIASFLQNAGWVKEPVSVSFLAAGEYNENYVITDSAGSKSVFRINHGSQLGLENQIEYEFKVLKAIESSGVTPKPYYYDNTPEGFEKGVLLMEFLYGDPLDYKEDRHVAAEIFSRIHRLPISADLIVQENPILDIADESYSMIARYSGHPLQKEKKILLDYYNEIVKLGEEKAEFFKNESMCIVNTEVNSHNFLISETSGFLVDWEKAVNSYRYQDLGHFLVPTTTLWKTDHVYSKSEKLSFLKHYYDTLSLDLSFEELTEKTQLLENTILLRGLSWCYMAYYEYTETERSLSSQSTFEKIQSYLDRIDWFLNI